MIGNLFRKTFWILTGLTMDRKRKSFGVTATFLTFRTEVDVSNGFRLKR